MQRRIAIIAIVALAVALGATCRASADEIEVRASVDRTTLSMYEYLRLTVSVSGVGMRGAGQPQLPPMDALDVAGTSSSQRVNIVNGRISTSHETVYQLMPIRVGKTRIGPIKVRYKGKEYSTKPIDITITKSPFNEDRKRAESDAREQGGNAAAEVPSGASDRDLGREDVFIDAEVAPVSAYVGQKVIVSFYLYTRASLEDINLVRLPDFEGFWSEPLEAPGNLSFIEVDLDGYAYRKALLRRYALFPVSAGDLVVEPFVLQVAKRVSSKRSRRGFGGFPFDSTLDDFFGRRVREEIGSPAVPVMAKPLPAKGRPEGFAGNVGHYSIEAQLDKAEVKAGDAVTLKVSVWGDGNIKALEAPEVSLPESFKSYPPKTEEEVYSLHKDFKARRDFEFILVPRTEGVYQIPEVAVRAFNPETGVYERKKAGPLSVKVLPGEIQPDREPIVLSKEQIQLSGKDIRYIKPDADALEDEGGYLLDGLLWKLIHALLPVVILGVYLGGKRRERISKDIGRLRVRRARGAAKKRLRTARNLLDPARGREFFAELHKALVEYVADRLNLPAAGLTGDSIDSLLAGKGVDAETVSAVKEVLGLCDLYRFSASTPERAQMDRAYQEAARIIDHLEKTGRL